MISRKQKNFRGWYEYKDQDKTFVLWLKYIKLIILLLIRVELVLQETTVVIVCILCQSWFKILDQRIQRTIEVINKYIIKSVFPNSIRNFVTYSPGMHTLRPTLRFYPAGEAVYMYNKRPNKELLLFWGMFMHTPFHFWDWCITFCESFSSRNKIIGLF